MSHKNSGFKTDHSRFFYLVYAWRDLKREKIRTTFAILGVAISIFLLTVVGSLSDSMSYSYLDQATSQAGSADIMFSKVIQADFNYDPYFDQNLIQDKLRPNIDTIDYYFPRILSIVQVDFYNAYYNKTVQKQIIFYGINTTLEQNSGKMGNLYRAEYKQADNGEYKWVATDKLFMGPIPEGHCIVTDGFAKLFNITRIGQTINITFSRNKQVLIIDDVVSQDLRFSSFENTLVIVELPQAQEFLDQPGKVNYVMATLKNREYIYDTRDIEETIRRLRLVGEEIQNLLGFDYSITLPKVQQLESMDNQSMQMNMMFGFLSFFSMMITGILINSILSTSIEEKIREFGILRTLGGRRKLCFQLVLSTGFFIAVIGTGIGVSLGSFAAPALLNWYFSTFNIWKAPVTFIILPQTIFTSLFIGIGVTLGVSLIPAFKAGRTELTKAIDPARSHEEEKYEIKKEGSANLKLIIAGFGMGLMGIIIFLIFPSVISTQDQNLTVVAMILLLFVVLIGLVLFTLGVIPLLQNFIGLVLKPFIRKYYPVYKISLKRYRRRNTSTTIMFALTFAFIFFTSTSLQMRSANFRALFEFQYGADLVISNTGTPDQGNFINDDFYNQLLDMPGIRSAAPAYHNSLDVSLALGMTVKINEGELSISDLNLGDYFGVLPKKEVYIGDLADYKNYYCNVIGINRSYTETIRTDLMMWDRETGSGDQSLEDMFNTYHGVIIAKVLADALNIHELGTKIRLITRDPQNPNVKSNVSVYTVVGVSRGLPGFYNMRSAKINLYLGAGVLMKSEDYCELMNWGNPDSSNTVIDKIFIKLTKNDYESLKEVQSYIKDYFGDEYSFEINEVVSLIHFMERTNDTTNKILQTVLFFSIIISLFGLMSSMYSTLIERMFEIGILRAMGMKPYEVRNLLIAESLTLVLSSGSLGMLIGIFIAYLMFVNAAVITEIPVVVVLDYGAIALTYLVSILVSIIGMILITRKVRKWQVVDIIRSTFS